MEQYAHEFFGSGDIRDQVPRGSGRPVAPGAPKPGGRGSGDKSRVGRKSNEVREDAAYIDYGIAKARRESALADIAEMDAAEKAGELVDRQMVRDATATAFATVAQNLRSIPDALERRLALAPEVVEAVETMIDEILDGLANDMKKLNDGAR